MQYSFQHATPTCSYRPKDSETHGSRIPVAGLWKSLEIPKDGKRFFPDSSSKGDSIPLRETEGERSPEELPRQSLPHEDSQELAPTRAGRPMSCLLLRINCLRSPPRGGSRALRSSVSTHVSPCVLRELFQNTVRSLHSFIYRKFWTTHLKR